ncbi:hypothetical protein TNCV_2340251 [Trichonephila clavipes]|nr:hypothetical protein TNCV_2340251 [Trichonephila clavipes]
MNGSNVNSPRSRRTWMRPSRCCKQNLDSSEKATFFVIDVSIFVVECTIEGTLVRDVLLRVSEAIVDKLEVNAVEKHPLTVRADICLANNLIS